MDPIILASVLVNAAALAAFISGIVAHFNESWTHDLRGFVTLSALSFFLAEVWMMVYSLEGGLLALVCISALLIIAFAVMVVFGFKATVYPLYRRVTNFSWFTRVAAPSKPKPLGISRATPHLLSR